MKQGLIALAMRLANGSYIIRILDLNGLHRMDLPVSVRPGDCPWFRLLRGDLIVAEENTLKLYSLKEETEKQKE